MCKLPSAVSGSWHDRDNPLMISLPGFKCDRNTRPYATGVLDPMRGDFLKNFFMRGSNFQNFFMRDSFFQKFSYARAAKEKISQEKTSQGKISAKEKSRKEKLNCKNLARKNYFLVFFLIASSSLTSSLYFGL